MDLQSERAGGADYRDFGWESDRPTRANKYVFPAVVSLAGRLGPGVRVLDVGCGNGYVAGRLLELGCTVVGIDLSERGIAIARERYPAARFEVLPADGKLLARLDEPAFDFVVATEVIEHLYDPFEFAAGCYDALSPGGRVILSAPYHGYAKNAAIALAGRHDSHFTPLVVGGHIRFWSRATITRLLIETGFSDVRFAGAGRVPYLWKSLVVSGDRRPGVAAPPRPAARQPARTEVE
jgi:SAM-dependent methyltransferase